MQQQQAVALPHHMAERILRSQGLLMRAVEDCHANAQHTGDRRFVELAEAVDLAVVGIEHLHEQAREIADSYERLE